MITEEKVLCKRCNRELTDDVSIQRGYGPVCWLKAQEEKMEEQYEEYYTG